MQSSRQTSTHATYYNHVADRPETGALVSTRVGLPHPLCQSCALRHLGALVEADGTSHAYVSGMSKNAKIDTKVLNLISIYNNCTNECMLAADAKLAMSTIIAAVKRLTEYGCIERSHDGKALCLTDAQMRAREDFWARKAVR